METPPNSRTDTDARVVLGDIFGDLDHVVGFEKCFDL